MRAVNTLISSAWISPLLALASFALVGAITPGPVNVLALRHGAQGMHRQALLYVLGASVSYMGVVACMALGSAQLQHSHPGLLHPAQWLCAAYLLWLAIGLARAPVQPAKPMPATATDTPSHWQAFGQGVTVQVLNPKAWLFAWATVGVYAIPLSPTDWAPLLWLCAISLLACLLGVGCWAVLGRALLRWLQTAERHKALNRSLAVLLVLSTAAMLA